MIKLVNAAVNGCSITFNGETPNWKVIYEISKKSSLLNLISYGIDNLSEVEKPTAAVCNKFLEAKVQGIVKDTNQIYELNRIMKSFEKADIPHLMFKGAVIKFDYPQTNLRFMGDIDVLVKKEDYSLAQKNLSDHGFTKQTHGENTVDEYIKEPFTVVELHKEMIAHSETSYNYWKKIWDRAVLRNGFSNSFIPTKEDTYIFMTVHTVKHFYHGGIAARILLDYYVFLEKYKGKLDFVYIDKYLNEFGYKKFEEKIKSLAYKWFKADDCGLEKDELSMFIVKSQTYGRLDNNVLIRAASIDKTNAKSSKFKFVISQVFPSRKSLEEDYTLLKKAPALLPFIWMEIIFKRIFIKRDLKFETSKFYNKIKEENISYIRRIHEELGL